MDFGGYISLCEQRRRQKELLDTLDTVIASAECDICGEWWHEDHTCNAWSLRNEIARLQTVLDELPHSPIDHGWDDALDSRIAELEKRLSSTD